MNKDEYIIINRTAIQKRIDNLDLIINDGKPSGSDYIELKLLKQILSQSTPLIPEIINKILENNGNMERHP